MAEWSGSAKVERKIARIDKKSSIENTKMKMSAAEGNNNKEGQDSKRSGLEVEQGKSKHHRPQTYRKKWESQAKFTGWLKPVAGSDSKAFCHCCNTELVAEITVLKYQSKSKRQKGKRKKLSSNTKVHNRVPAGNVRKEKA